jgi:hypothetical protein
MAFNQLLDRIAMSLFTALAMVPVFTLASGAI